MLGREGVLIGCVDGDVLTKIVLDPWGAKLIPSSTLAVQ